MKLFFATILNLLIVISALAANLALHDQGDSVTFSNPTTTGATQTASLMAEIRYGGNGDGYIVGANDDFDLRISNGRIQWYAFSGTQSLTITTPAQYDDSQFHLIVAIQNGLNLELWVDGVQTNSTAFSGATNRARKIQALGQRGNSTNYAKGTWRRVGLWSKALSAGEIATLWNNGTYSALSAQANLVAAYNCDEGTGTTITDVSGNNKNGTINNPNSVYSSWIDTSRTTPTTFYASPTGTIGNNGTASNAAWSLAYALSHPPTVIPGDTIKLVSGTYSPTAKLSAYLTGTSANPINIETDSPRGTFPNVVKIDGANITSAGTVLSIYGKWANYWDLEVFNSNPDRVSTLAGSHPSDIKYLAGIDVFGSDLKIYYAHLHDNSSNGLTVFDPLGTTEIIDAISYNNGWTGTDGGHGHGVYTHNGNSAASIIYRNFVTFNNYFYLIQHYSSQSTSDSYNIEWRGVHGSGGQGVGIVGAGPKHNFIFYDANVHAPITFGYSSEGNFELDCRRMIVQSFNSPVTMRAWATRNVQDSTLISLTTNLSSALGRIAQINGGLGATTYSNNAYYAKTGANLSQLMRYETQSASLLNYWTFAQWQSNLNIDLDSTANITASGKPTTNAIKYYPDSVTAGRGLLVIWNWQNLANVSVDLSNYGLVQNQNYKIYDVYNVGAGIISQGTYNSGSPTISLSTASNGVSQKINDAANTEPSLLPEFGIFIVVPGAVAAGAPNAPGLPSLPTKPILSTSSTAIQINWVDNSSDETNFLVRYRVGQGAWTQQTVAANSTQYSQTGLTPATTYEAQVASVNANGQSAWVELGFATTTVIRHFGATEPR